MKLITVFDVLNAVNGSLLSGDPEAKISGITIDSRVVKSGDLFFAFPGNRVDGHLFVEEAFKAGAAAAVVSKRIMANVNKTLILVKDTFKALQDLARCYRKMFEVPVIGVTGSTGKTTTKDIIAGVLAIKSQVLKTEGNQNNEIGLPLTLLKLESKHDFVVLEMAMRGKGEISELCKISNPNIGVITNIGRAHLEKLGSQKAIAEAKGELISALPPDGCAILNGDDYWQLRLAEKVRCNLLFYGENEHCSIRALNIRLCGLDGVKFLLKTPNGEVDCFLPVPGRHNVSNALAGAAVGYWFGYKNTEIASGLGATSLTGMRLEVKSGFRGCRIIDDSYNASPDSVKAALKLLADINKENRTIAVLGDMYELGSEAVACHEEIGVTAAKLDIDLLCTVGDLAKEIARGARFFGMPESKIRIFDNKYEALDFLRDYLDKGDVVLIKGSRASRMDILVDSLCCKGDNCE